MRQKKNGKTQISRIFLWCLNFFGHGTVGIYNQMLYYRLNDIHARFQFFFRFSMFSDFPFKLFVKHSGSRLKFSKESL